MSPTAPLIPTHDRKLAQKHSESQSPLMEQMRKKRRFLYLAAFSHHENKREHPQAHEHVAINIDILT